MEKEGILVEFNSSRKIFKVPSSAAEFENDVNTKFGIDKSVKILIQCFNENWQEYIDLPEDQEIAPGKKYRIVLDTPKIMYIENAVANCASTDTSSESNLPIISSIFDNSGASENDFTQEIGLLPIGQDNFIIPSKDFSSRLRLALQDQVPLTRVLRSELVHCICASVSRHTKYPTSIMMTDMARAIISEFPYLRESIGSGYGGWRQALRDKFKNLRRLDESNEVLMRKKSCVVNKLLKKDQTSEKEIDIESQLVYNVSTSVSCQLNESFDIRRDEIVNQRMKVEALQLKYPDLFSEEHFLEEFFRITGKSDIFQCITNFLELYSESLYKMLLAKKNLPQWVEALKSVLDESNTEKARDEFVLISLPVHFNEDQLLLTYPATTTSDDIKNAGYSSPHVGVIGIHTKQVKYFVLAEHEIILNCSSLAEAVAILIASYFVVNCEYPKRCFKTLMFIEKVIFDIQSEKKKLPSSVINFAQKLKNSMIKSI